MGVRGSATRSKRAERKWPTGPGKGAGPFQDALSMAFKKQALQGNAQDMGNVNFCQAVTKYWYAHMTSAKHRNKTWMYLSTENKGTIPKCHLINNGSIWGVGGTFSLVPHFLQGT